MTRCNRRCYGACNRLLRVNSWNRRTATRLLRHSCACVHRFLSSSILSKLWRFSRVQRHAILFRMKTLRTVGFELIRLSEAIFDFCVCFSIREVGYHESTLKSALNRNSHLSKRPARLRARTFGLKFIEALGHRVVFCMWNTLNFKLPSTQSALEVDLLPPDNCVCLRYPKFGFKNYRWPTFDHLHRVISQTRIWSEREKVEWNRRRATLPVNLWSETLLWLPFSDWRSVICALESLADSRSLQSLLIELESSTVADQQTTSLASQMS